MNTPNTLEELRAAVQVEVDRLRRVAASSRITYPSKASDHALAADNLAALLPAQLKAGDRVRRTRRAGIASEGVVLFAGLQWVIVAGEGINEGQELAWEASEVESVR